MIKIAKANQSNPYMDITPQELSIGFPFVHYTGFFPEEMETLIYAVPAKVFFDKEQVVAYSSKYGGGSARIGKSASIHSGKSQSRPVRSNVRKYHNGDLLITNKRIIFVGTDESFEFKTDKITTVKLIGKDSFVIQSGRTSKNIIVDPLSTAYAYGYINYVSSENSHEELFLAITADRQSLTVEQIQLCKNTLNASQQIKIPKEKNVNGCLCGVVRILFIVLILAIIGGIIAISIAVIKGKPEEPSTQVVEAFTLSQYNSTNISIAVDEHDSVTIYVTPFDTEEANIELVVENPSVAKCLVQDVRAIAGKKLIIISYRGLAIGETTFYVKDKNSDMVSDTIHLTITEKETEEQDTSRKVYLNYSGDKYHFSKSCAGSSAYESTLNQARVCEKNSVNSNLL